MAICEKCKYENVCEMPAFIRNDVNKCRVFEERKLQKPITNADRIRSMTDEELAEFLLKVNSAYAMPCMTDEKDCKWEDYPTHDKGCKDCFLDWLQSEVEGVTENE